MKSRGHFQEFKIETGIPLPGLPNRRAFLRELKPGESFVDDIKKRSCWGDAIHRIKRENKRADFATRKIDAKRIRIWRVK